MGLLSGKNGIIVGASQGIGLGIAKKFVQEGGNIVMTARNLEKLEASLPACAFLKAGTVNILFTPVILVPGTWS